METKGLILLSLATSAFLTGLVWFVQVVHYPGFMKVGAEAFADYHRFHTSATAQVVVVPMILELGLAFVLFALAQTPANGIGLGLVLAVWILTFVWIVPVHGVLETGLDISAARKLVWLNLLRSLLWTARLGLLGWQAYRMLGQ